MCARSKTTETAAQPIVLICLFFCQNLISPSGKIGIFFKALHRSYGVTLYISPKPLNPYKMKPIISVKELKNSLNDPDLMLLDASPAATISGERSSLEGKTIPEARSFDLKNCFSNLQSSFPNTVPSPAQFEEECLKLGIRQSSNIVVFDNLGIYTSPRVWWLFKVMGHDNISVLDGGLPEWVKAGFSAVDKVKEEHQRGSFRASYQKDLVVSYDQVLGNLDDKGFTVVDARAAGRFHGTSPEPRKNLQSGCIPNSVNIPYKEVLTARGTLKSPEELRALFEQQGVGHSSNLVFSCGSGLTACIIMLAHEVGCGNGQRIYDGSWTEWATLQGLFTEAT